MIVQYFDPSVSIAPTEKFRELTQYIIKDNDIRICVEEGYFYDIYLLSCVFSLLYSCEYHQDILPSLRKIGSLNLFINFGVEWWIVWTRPLNALWGRMAIIQRILWMFSRQMILRIWGDSVHQIHGTKKTSITFQQPLRMLLGDSKGPDVGYQHQTRLLFITKSSTSIPHQMRLWISAIDSE